MIASLPPLLDDAWKRAVWLVILIVIFVPLERLLALHPAKVWRKEIGVDLAWYFINSLFPAAVVSVPLALAVQGLHRLDPAGYYTAASHWTLWIRLPLMLLVNDLGAYWGHRALHAFPRLWRFHSIHHSPENLDWLVNTRAHPLDIVVMKFAGLAPVYLLGLGEIASNHIDPAVALVTIIVTVWNFFLHANIRIRLGPLESIISSPAFHHWHHCNDRRRDRNFSFIFPFIDRVFGTAHQSKEWPERYGVDESVPATISEQFFYPIDPPAETAPRRLEPVSAPKTEAEPAETVN